MLHTHPLSKHPSLRIKTCSLVVTVSSCPVSQMSVMRAILPDFYFLFLSISDFASPTNWMNLTCDNFWRNRQHTRTSSRPEGTHEKNWTQSILDKKRNKNNLSHHGYSIRNKEIFPKSGHNGQRLLQSPEHNKSCHGKWANCLLHSLFTISIFISWRHDPFCAWNI